MIAQSIVRSPLLAADEMLKLHQVAYKEDRRIVAYHVEITVSRVKLDREAARVSPNVRAPTLAGYSGETSRCPCYAVAVPEYARDQNLPFARSNSDRSIR
jgi:hypothetical protein